MYTNVKEKSCYVEFWGLGRRGKEEYYEIQDNQLVTTTPTFTSTFSFFFLQ